MKKLSIIFTLAAGLLLSTGISNTYAQSNTDEASTITITEYSDYECPACAYYHPFVKKLMDEYGDQIELELKFYPLNSHQFSALAARAAQAAKNQGKFAEMHNLLFKNQRTWKASGNPTPKFMNYARELGLDMQQFESELNAAETQRIVMEQKQEGRQAGVRATPTFIIEGEKLDPLPRTYAEFEQAVKHYLDQKSES